MGEVEVPRDALWRAQTQRAVENFPISGTPAGARPRPGAWRGSRQPRPGQRRAGHHRPAEQADAITAAARRDRRRASTTTHSRSTCSRPGPARLEHEHERGAGLARAAAPGVEVHPNDHVNASQSSNDTFPTSIHVAATSAAVRTTWFPRSTTSPRPWRPRPRSSPTVVKSGRTHLMDATPVMLGQEFGGYAAAMRYGDRAARAAAPPGRRAAAGRHRGRHRHQHARTASPPRSSASSPRRPACRSPRPATTSRPRARVTRSWSCPASCGRSRSGLTKLCNDLRWMSSGPRTGLAEIPLPDLQPGSSIMPGKVNPVLPEATLMVCAQVIGNDATVDRRRRQPATSSST